MVFQVLEVWLGLHLVSEYRQKEITEDTEEQTQKDKNYKIMVS